MKQCDINIFFNFCVLDHPVPEKYVVKLCLCDCEPDIGKTHQIKLMKFGLQSFHLSCSFLATFSGLIPYSLAYLDKSMISERFMIKKTLVSFVGQNDIEAPRIELATLGYERDALTTVLSGLSWPKNLVKPDGVLKRAGVSGTGTLPAAVRIIKFGIICQLCNVGLYFSYVDLPNSPYDVSLTNGEEVAAVFQRQCSNPDYPPFTFHLTAEKSYDYSNKFIFFS
ncbi:hypothetical protein AVEN_84338-1 [Araneus ventricosus]|uniref:Uncharacterized protein n=1 Tax=Araneus ventricosus TaxID=182803 RepID=A0A4Y2K710_ARAVE|nr:hypothetical protein AVEN_84338-1 [Araneus ventricosus]